MGCIYCVTLYYVAVTNTRIKSPIHTGSWRQASYSPVTSHFCRDVMRALNCSDSDMYSTNMKWLPVCKGEQADQKDLMRVCHCWVRPTTRTFKAASSTLQLTQKRKKPTGYVYKAQRQHNFWKFLIVWAADELIGHLTGMINDSYCQIVPWFTKCCAYKLPHQSSSAVVLLVTLLSICRILDY